MEMLVMSANERRRLEVLCRVRSGELSLRKASELLSLSYRQAKRVYSRYKTEGDAGVVHQLRGRSSNRRTDEAKKTRVLELFREKYADFGPTLAAEYLAKEDEEEVAVETLRQWRKGKRGRQKPSVETGQGQGVREITGGAFHR